LAPEKPQWWLVYHHVRWSYHSLLCLVLYIL
jgi:hypothetical protein